MYNRKEFTAYLNGITEPITVHGDLTFKQAAMNAMDIALYSENELILCVKDAKEVKGNEPYNMVVKCEHKVKRFIVTVKPNDLAIEGIVNKWQYRTRPLV